MQIEYLKHNKTKALLSYAVPSIIAMLLETVISVTDGYFTGNYVGETALAAINLGLPVRYFYLGTGLCIGAGGSVICGRLLGTGDRDKASRVLSQTQLYVRQYHRMRMERGARLPHGGKAPHGHTRQCACYAVRAGDHSPVTVELFTW